MTFRSIKTIPFTEKSPLAYCSLVLGNVYINLVMDKSMSELLWKNQIISKLKNLAANDKSEVKSIKLNHMH